MMKKLSTAYSKILSGHYLQKIDHLLFDTARIKHIRKKGRIILDKLSVNSEYKVLNGVFKDLQYPSMEITESALVPKIIGSYEYQLQGWFGQIVSTGYKDIIDIGSAEGYYAVGLAKKMPDTIVHCYDINEKDIEFSKYMAKVNGVTNMTWNTFCDANTLTQFPHRGKTLIISDCEGYELELFTNAVVDSCRHADVLIELHDVFNPVISAVILSRFQNTHEFRIVNNKDVEYGRLDGLQRLSETERQFAVCEHRGGLNKNIYMEWVFLTSKESA